jgi:cytochrome c peroxidase
MAMASGVTKIVVLVLLTAVLVVVFAATAWALTDEEELGKYLFFDSNLSEPAGQACAACHGPSVGYTGPDASINAAGAVYEGAVAGRFGNRKPPAAAYAGDSPILRFDGKSWVGGMFWDGRATGWTLGDPLAEQALGPFLNPLEQNNASAQVVVEKVKTSTYAALFETVWGPDAFADPAKAYEHIGRSIAAYERSEEVNAYSSRYDTYLKTGKGLTGQELLGLKLFTTKAKCVSCHSGKDFTDYGYDNLGIPKNLMNPFYNESAWNPLGEDWVDLGLGDFLEAAGYDESVYGPEMGKFKVPTLRNVDKRPYPKFVKAYGHNGYFKSLQEIVHFYNTRDVPEEKWPAAEVAMNINTTEVGNLGLNKGQELAIVAFLRTLTDQ